MATNFFELKTHSWSKRGKRFVEKLVLRFSCSGGGCGGRRCCRRGWNWFGVERHSEGVFLAIANTILDFQTVTFLRLDKRMSYKNKCESNED